MTKQKEARCIEIDGRKIGPDHPPYVIAEMSGNHNRDISRAFGLIDAAKESGADAVKLQTYTADTITIDHDGPGFTLEGGLWDGRKLYDLYEEANTPWEWHKELFEHAKSVGITVFSSPFDFTAIDFLEELGAPAYKIASFEAMDIPLVKKAASTGKPVIISIGVSSLAEAAETVDAVRECGNDQICLLHCVSAYPSRPEDANLATIPHLGEAFDVVVGLSDHSPGTALPSAAVALGAAVIEKHVTLARSDGGPDSAFSLEPNELTRLVEDTRAAWAAKGKVNYGVKGEDEARMGRLRRSLYVVEDVAAGEPLTESNVRSIRPGYGLKPKFLPDVLGRTARRALKRGEPLSWDLLG
ncbi:pseudaminic acid synthase [Labrenzia sp. OB1]|uniref:pseudaminic acid synthase n=1 Tax=Labrenzia sp. OB1 TaxID=1561204 RepID=UPI0007B2EB2F|nr:pseudaminic acid synthase [Labrenzia sp. OB1]KZM49932.1 N-acetylneuraminate synthase [Labrenzia sp. OB1]